MPYECTIKRVQPQPTLSIRGRTSVGELPRTFGEYMREVWSHLEKSGQRPAGPPFTRYHAADDLEAIDFEAGFIVGPGLAGAGRVQAGALPGGEVIATDHFGPYEHLPRAGEALDQWLVDNDRTAAGPNWEYCWTDPGAEPDPAKWHTEVQKPLAAA
jgi:effector-binding domain-containing protein